MSAVLAACAPSAGLAPDIDVAADSAEVVLFFAARTWQGQAAWLHETCDDLLETTELLGPTRTAWASAPAAERATLPEQLRSALAALRGNGRTVRAAVVVLGDLSVLHGIDPSRDPEEFPGLSSRAVAPADIAALHDACRDIARAAGVDFLAATAPLGRAAETEVAELLRVAAWLREAAGHTLDLGARFAPHADRGLFANGFDVLNEWGAARLVRELHATLLHEEGPLAPRNADETGARVRQRALQALAFGPQETSVIHLPDALADESDGLIARAQRAALLAAAHRQSAANEAWAALPADAAHEVPGLGLGRQLAGLQASPQLTRDEVEVALRLLVMWRDNPTGPTDLGELAQGMLTRHPHRIEGWIALGLRAEDGELSPELRAAALRHMTFFEGASVSLDTATDLVQSGSAALATLPALVMAQRPFVRLPPDTPLLGQLRRRADLGYEEHALIQLRRAGAGLRLPATWERLQAEWSERAAARAALVEGPPAER